METIIDLIYDNLFFVIILLIGLINLLGGSKSDKKQNRERPQRRQVSPAERKTQPATRKIEQKSRMTRAEQLEAEKKELETKSIEQQRQEQFERLKQQFQSSYTLDEMEQINIESQNENQLSKSDSSPRQKELESVELKLENRFTREGLIESVIMAEVLGPPKARKKLQRKYMKRNY